MILTANDIILAACRAHAPQFDRMDVEIKQYAMEQMRAAIIVAVTDLVKAGRSILDNGADPEDGALDDALEPFEELIPYDSTVEADISAAMADASELPYQCDPCSTPGYGSNAPCSCSPSPSAEIEALKAENEHLANKIEDLIAEFGDDPKAALECVSEYLSLRRHGKAEVEL